MCELSHVQYGYILYLLPNLEKKSYKYKINKRLLILYIYINLALLIE